MHSLSADPTRVERGDKCFRYLLSSQSRADLDIRLEIFRRVCVPHIFTTAEEQDEYFSYLLKTRFAPVGHPSYLQHDRRARSHCVYGQQSAPEVSMFNMNLEAMIKVLFVDSLNRRAFRTALPLFEFFVGSNKRHARAAVMRAARQSIQRAERN